jgi:hypothetical protein
VSGKCVSVRWPSADVIDELYIFIRRPVAFICEKMCRSFTYRERRAKGSVVLSPLRSCAISVYTVKSDGCNTRSVNNSIESTWKNTIERSWGVSRQTPRGSLRSNTFVCLHLHASTLERSESRGVRGLPPRKNTIEAILGGIPPDPSGLASLERLRMSSPPCLQARAKRATGGLGGCPPGRTQSSVPYTR